MSLASKDYPRQSGSDIAARAANVEPSGKTPTALHVRDQLRQDDSDAKHKDPSSVLSPSFISNDLLEACSLAYQAWNEVVRLSMAATLPNTASGDQVYPGTSKLQPDCESVASPENRILEEENFVKIFDASLDSVFQDWLGNGVHESASGEAGPSRSSSSSTGLPGTRSSGKRPVKRKRSEIPGEENNNGQQKSGKRPQTKHPLHFMLACHFCKRDPRLHRNCCNFGGAKISHVKQHIYRKHSIDVYCPRCMEQFNDVSSRDQHTRLGACELRDIACRPDGITSEQRDWMSRRMPSGTSEEKRWYIVWNYLFPELPRPSSPYNNFDLSEDLFEFSDFITSTGGYDLLLRNLRGNAAWTEEHESLFGPDLTSALGQLFLRWAAIREERQDQRDLESHGDEELVRGETSPATSADSHPTESSSSSAIQAARVDDSALSRSDMGAALAPQDPRAMDVILAPLANPTPGPPPAGVYEYPTIQETEVERFMSADVEPDIILAPGYHTVQPQRMSMLQFALNRAEEAHTTDWGLQLDMYKAVERKEDETEQPSLQLMEGGFDQAGPPGQIPNIAAHGFDFGDFGPASDVLPDSSLQGWEYIDMESGAPEGPGGDYWKAE